MRLKTLLTALGVTSAAERAPVATEETIAGTSETGDEVPRMESKMAIDIKGLSEIAGFIGACLVDSETGLMMASEGSGSFDLEGAAAANTEVVKAKLNAMKLLGLKDHIEDILITLGKQYHLIRPMEKSPSVFIYVALDRKAANLGMARVQVKNVEQALSF
jgi:predicted regulator of Ras-like GTPase activity (Roadblock/LC7/MglB family)